ncbi:MAG: Crp/Fnr family transcriptional regulator [Proteobacteria bacterium]|nr:Crp/Fnr family transcriptional regulator [Pseudomonadota bacterium]
MIESDYLKNNEELIEKMSKIPELGIFDDKDLHGLMKLSKIRKYEPGEIIIEEGCYDSWIYYLISGKVKVVKENEDIGIMQRTGDVFGEMGVIDGSARSASVYAVTESVCLATDTSYIDRLSGNNKVTFGYILYKLFAEILASRLRVANQELIKTKAKLTMVKLAKKLELTSEELIIARNEIDKLLCSGQEE